MRKPALFALLILSPFFNNVYGLNLKGVELPAQVQPVDQMPQLVLNGAGVRHAYGLIEVYVGALYLQRKLQDATQVLADDGAKRMEFHLLRTVSGRQINEQFFEGLQINHSQEELQQLGAEIAELKQLLENTSRFPKGSVAQFDYVPDTERMEISLDGDLIGSVEGKGIYNAVLAIWIGERPVSAEFKEGVLGQTSDQ